MGVAELRRHLLAGQVIPAHPLALTAERRLDERRQRALTRYYVDAGAGGIAVGVHTTQFAIREAQHALLRPVVELAAETVRSWTARRDGAAAGAGALPISTTERLADELATPGEPFGPPPRFKNAPGPAPGHHHSIPSPPNPGAFTSVMAGTPTIAQPAAPTTAAAPSSRVALIAGACGPTAQAVAEARLAADFGYDAVLLSLGGLVDQSDDALIAHCRAVSDVRPLIGFYLQPAVGGRRLGFAFWRRLAELPELIAIKIAPFNRYATIDVIRAVAEAGRDDVALYTGNDDAIVTDLLTPWPFHGIGRTQSPVVAGGLLGQWAVWTRRAVDLLRQIQHTRHDPAPSLHLLATGAALTDANGAIFDVAHAFAGCIPGIHEVLRRTGLLAGTWCLDPAEQLSLGQASEIDRILRSYPELTDDAFVAEHLDVWLAP